MNFEGAVDKQLRTVRELLIRKNAAYGNSALEPCRIFSGASPSEQIKVRIDDKLSRIANSRHRAPAEVEDTVLDLIGYLVLLRISEEEDVNQWFGTQQTLPFSVPDLTL